MDEKEIDNEYGFEEETSERNDSEVEVDSGATETEEANTSVEDSAVESQEVESNDVDFENNYTTPTDYSWLVNVSDEDISKSLEDKASDLSTAEAKSGLSTELNNPFHEETKSEFMENEAIPFATAQELETGWRDTSKPGNSKEELEEAQKKLDEDKDLFSPEQKRRVADFDPNKGSAITDVAHILTLGIAPTFNKVKDFDKVAYSSFVEKRAKETGDADKAIRDVNKLIEGSQLGLAKEGVEYWRETGQTLGNKYAEKAEQTVVNALVAYENGQITEDQMNALVESVTNPSSSDQLISLFSSPALTGLEAMAAGAAIGAAASKIIEKGAPVIFNKLIQSDSKLGRKIVEKIASNKAVQNRYKYDTLKEAFEAGPYAEQATADVTDWGRKLAKAIVDGDKAATKQLMDSKKTADNLAEIFGKGSSETSPLENIMYDLVNNGMDDVAKAYAKEILDGGTSIIQEDLDLLTEVLKNPSEYADWFTAMSQSLGYVNPSDMAKVITAAIAENDSIKKGLAATGITGATIAEAKAAPTGIFDKKGKMIDSKEVVAERKDKPYEGEDAVTLYTREGKVSVSPREAVIIGEAEGLPPSSGYTDKVKEAAKGSEVYETPPIQMTQPTDEQIGFWQKAGDIIQAILGGRDLNNDKTITKSEWYESTIGKVVNNFKEIFGSGKSDAIDKVGEKSTWQKIKDKFSSVLDSVGNSIPGVVDLKNGTAYINPALDKPNLDLSPQAITGTIENAVANSLPNWSDSAGQELKKNIVSATVSEALASNVFGNFGVITAAKIVGQYVTSTVSEIAHLYGKDLDNDEKGAINFIVTNAVGLPLAPVSAAIRDTGASLYGVATRHGIENVFDNGSAVSDFYIIPYDTSTADSSDAEYGTATDTPGAADSKYSGYREQAKDSNLATDYNEGLEQQVNEAVSSKDVKKFIVKTYNSEPEYVRNSLNKIIATLKGENVF